MPACSLIPTRVQPLHVFLLVLQHSQHQAAAFRAACTPDGTQGGPAFLLAVGVLPAVHSTAERLAGTRDRWSAVACWAATTKGPRLSSCCSCNHARCTSPAADGWRPCLQCCLPGANAAPACSWCAYWFMPCPATWYTYVGHGLLVCQALSACGCSRPAPPAWCAQSGGWCELSTCMLLVLHVVSCARNGSLPATWRLVTRLVRSPHPAAWALWTSQVLAGAG
jgi:hypothetical protein